jgi:hypothetical protein|tara:strand:+ start:1065 stop:1412 length:348 start_codon:yes stop_codon:yes gene_type:complete
MLMLDPLLFKSFGRSRPRLTSLAKVGAFVDGWPADSLWPLNEFFFLGSSFYFWLLPLGSRPWPLPAISLELDLGFTSIDLFLISWDCFGVLTSGFGAVGALALSGFGNFGGLTPN